MKNIIIIFSLLLIFNALSAQNERQELIYNSKVHYNKIHEVGQKHYFYQHCITDIDSLVCNGVITHHNASIGNLEKCKYSIFIKDTIIDYVTLSTNCKKNTEELQKLIKSISFGFNDVEHLMSNLYYWSDIVSINQRKCYLLFVSERRNKSGYLKISRIKTTL